MKAYLSKLIQAHHIMDSFSFLPRRLRHAIYPLTCALNHNMSKPLLENGKMGKRDVRCPCQEVYVIW